MALDETLILGRDRECDLSLSDPSVSGRHAKIEWSGDGLWLVDFGSTNGTWINDVKATEGRLEHGDRLRLGQTEITIEGMMRSTLVHPTESPEFGSFYSPSEEMRLVFGILLIVAPSDLTILIQGETGTGKELLAGQIHAHSSRADGPMVVVDATTLSSELAASELFGHEKGAFTDAHCLHKGAFERAQGGTLFLDEVGELSLAVQAKLLRVLESRSFTRVGGDEAIGADVRVVAATHRPLRDMVEEGSFREDLFYRLDEVMVEIPPLRMRSGDIPFLVERLAAEVAPRLGGDESPPRFTQRALRALRAHQWPGNVRELRNYVARVAALAGGREIDVEDLPPFVPESSLQGSQPEVEQVSPVLARRGEDPDGIRAVLARHEGNKAAAARELGIPVSTLRYRLKRTGIGEDVGEDE